MAFDYVVVFVCLNLRIINIVKIKKYFFKIAAMIVSYIPNKFPQEEQNEIVNVLNKW